MPTSTFSNQKFLIVAVKDGGEDSYHTLLPRNPDHVTATLAARPTLGFTRTELESTYAASRLAGTSFSLHPSLEPLIRLWEAGDMAITHRVGPMFTNIAQTPIDELRAARSAFYTGSILYPAGVAAHDKQGFGVASMIARDFIDSTGTARTVAESGFLGRLATRCSGFTGSSTLPMTIVTGQRRATSTLLGSHRHTRVLEIPHAGRRFNRSYSRVPTQDRALARLDAIMGEVRSEARMEAFRRSNLVANGAVSFFQQVIEDAPGSYSVDADFPGNPVSGWPGTMRTFARTIERHLRMPALHNRTIFIGTRGEYDTHGNQGKVTGALPLLHEEFASALVSLRAAMIRLGVWNNVLVVDHSEFSRSLRQNGANGTDHAYARDAFAFGGPVRGRGKDGSTGLFGSYPTVLSASQTGSHDLHGGSLAPGISMEQYWEAVLRWFGADSSDLLAALPRRPEFGPAVDLIV